jgi:hypothetical protein
MRMERYDLHHQNSAEQKSRGNPLRSKHRKSGPRMLARNPKQHVETRSTKLKI